MKPSYIKTKTTLSLLNLSHREWLIFSSARKIMTLRLHSIKLLSRYARSNRLYFRWAISSLTFTSLSEKSLSLINFLSSKGVSLRNQIITRWIAKIKEKSRQAVFQRDHRGSMVQIKIYIIIMTLKPTAVPNPEKQYSNQEIYTQ